MRAPPHWVGHIGVADEEQSTARFLALGAQRLGPTALCDPSGAVLALSRETETRGRVAWHQLHATDRDAAVAAYASIFGWVKRELEDGHQAFAWDAAGPSVGSISGTVRLPYVHPHWLFFFRVDDLDAALARARDGGAKALDPIVTARGVLAALDDPQGGAFGIAQRQSGRC
jgi:predicted enzyme related to lactoylglutathione lyase